MKVWRQTDSCWFQTVQVGSCLPSREEHLGHLSSSSQCLFLIQILFVTSLHTTASYQTGELRWKHHFPSSHSPIHTPHPSKKVSHGAQQWRRQWENWSLAQQGSEIYFDFSVEIKEIKKKHTHSRELFRGENICHRGQNESPTKWNKRLWKKTCYARERTMFLLPCSLFSFVHSVYKALFVCLIIFSSMKEVGINFSLVGGSFIRKYFQNKSDLLGTISIAEHTFPK